MQPTSQNTSAAQKQPRATSAADRRRPRDPALRFLARQADRILNRIDDLTGQLTAVEGRLVRVEARLDALVTELRARRHSPRRQ